MVKFLIVVSWLISPYGLVGGYKYCFTSFIITYQIIRYHITTSHHMLCVKGYLHVYSVCRY